MAEGRAEQNGVGRMAEGGKMRNLNKYEQVRAEVLLPEMLEALEAVETVLQLQNTCGDGNSAWAEYVRVSNDAAEKVLTVLKKIREEK